jgi:hypothetical protein
MNIEKNTWKQSGMFRGHVMDNDDPKKWGRVKVGIPTLFQNIDTEYLPWAAPAMPMSVAGGAGHGFGCFCVPEVGTAVWVFFEGEDYNQPVYFAAAPDGVHGLPDEMLTNYPDRRVIKTSSGIVIYVDDIDQSIHIEMPSGGTVHIDAAGNVSLSADLDVTGDVEAQGTIDAVSGFATGGVAGVSGTFTSQDGKTVTVVNGIITLIV